MGAADGLDTDVLIAGAGPTGLVLALWLARMGVRVRIVDPAAEPGTTSRALAVQARTLEFYGQLGFANEVVKRGVRAGAVNLWVKGRRAAHAEFGVLGEGISPYPFALVFPQDEHERLLIEQLQRLGGQVERGTALVGFSETASGVDVKLQRADGADQTCTCAYLAGCDGAHSKVREGLKIGFPGGTYEHLFYVADVEGSGPVMNGELNVGLDAADFLAVFPMKGEGRVRLVGTICEADERKREDLKWKDVSRKVIGWMKIDVERVNWFSTYRVHHRVAERFRVGRAFLLGDAAHVHSPVGGQGMNTGIGDAVNLAWKLAAVVQRRAGASLLDSYEPERIAFARRLVATTDKAFVAVISESAMARAIRLRVVPWVMPLAFRLAKVKRLLFRTVSQTAIEYGESALSEGSAGRVRGGDRLPWVRLASGGDNFEALRTLDWQAHVYGAAAADVRAVCGERGLKLHEFAWGVEAEKTGLQRDVVYLVRPDGYVAVAGGSGRGIAEYLERWGVKPRGDGWGLRVEVGEADPLRG